MFEEVRKTVNICLYKIVKKICLNIFAIVKAQVALKCMQYSKQLLWDQPAPSGILKVTEMGTLFKNQLSVLSSHS